MQFQPGQSGNPGGRPPIVREFRQRCQNFMETKGWKQLEDLATSSKTPHQAKALELIASYAYGKPTQPISGDPDPDMPAIRVSVDFDRADPDEAA